MRIRLLPGLMFAALLTAAGPQTEGNAITGVRFWTLGDTTRVVVETTKDTEYKRDRVPDPDRVFFDLTRTRVTLGKKGITSIAVNDGRLRQIRIAQTQPDVARIVFDLQPNVDYSASTLSNPSRLIVEFRMADKPAVLSGAPPSTATEVAIAGPATSGTVQQPTAGRREAGREVRTGGPPNITRSPVDSGTEVRTIPLSRATGRDSTPAQQPALTPSPTEPGTDGRIGGSSSVARRREPSGTPPQQPSRDLGRSTKAAGAASAAVQPAMAVATAPELPPATPTQGLPIARKAPVSLPPPPKPAKLGDAASLTRVLGLKIGRIVLDPGHGGHDTGTLGPGGLVEKDLVLDVAQRLGLLIEQRLGAEVTYTRSDDTFIPLERRTEMANELKADLFLSIHANSSPVASSSGVETYYLNFTSSRAAMEVAARENASSQKTVYELKDLLQRIALQDKVEESKEFASLIQQSLYQASSRANSRTRDRGVRKAPFVVLIGASMPSVLAEIGFVSNPRDEALMKRPEFRQKLAEGLYQGVARYASTLSHFQVAQKNIPAAGQ